MPEEGLAPDDRTPWTAASRGDAQRVARMRLVLALAVLLALWVEPFGLPGMDPQRWPLFVAYGLYSLAVDMAAQRQVAVAHARWLHWLDLLWYAAMVALTGGVASMAFLFFLLPILTASFRWGQPEGGRVTLASGLAFLAASLLHGWPDAARLLLRSSFLLGLGYLCVHWGETQMQLGRRLALLREVSQLSNPRFGVAQTLLHVLERTRDFFGARQCLLVLRDPQTGQVWLHQPHLAQGQPQPLDAALAQALLGLAPHSLIVHRPAVWSGRPRTQGLSAARADPPGPSDRAPAPTAQAAQEVAGWLEVDDFISVPVALRQGQGRLYLGGLRARPTLDDALFLRQLVAQAFPVIDHIDLLDRMASEAAAREREKFALDLHDTAVQPYLGLRLALGALRQQAAPDNPLLPELDKLQAMAGRVSEELRHYAQQVRQQRGSGMALLAELRRQAAQVRDFYGVEIEVQADEALALNDRLSAEVLQLVREGLANICKHTLARRGQVRLHTQGGWLGICIRNEGAAARPFLPRSISERAAALGGRAQVQHETEGRTAVHIHIPV